MCSSTHSLATLSGMLLLQPEDGTAPSEINVPQTCKESTLCDHYLGICSTAQFLAESGKTKMATYNVPEVTSYHSMDPEDDDDFEYLRRRRSTDSKYCKKLDEVWKTEKLCRQSRQIPITDPKRSETLERAVACSDLCGRAHLMMFENETNMSRDKGESFDSHEEWVEAHREMNAHLYRAVEAGRKLKTFIGTDDLCKGNLFSYLPTRFYVRSLFALGSILFALGDMDEAELYLKECLANDIHDKLGARHKQLLLNLERSGGARGPDIKYLLKATFGEDQKQDEMFALWNYTRALYSFGKKGKSKEPHKLIKRAIEKNPHVPPLLLSWELSTYSQIFMHLGGQSEGSDYIRDNAKYWSDSSLEWLEDVYCKTTGIRPPLPDVNARAHLIKGTKLMTDAQNEMGPADAVALRTAINEFHILLGFLDRSVSSQKRLRKEVLKRKGICHDFLGEHMIALRYFNSALCLCKPTDVEDIKLLYYCRANSKEGKGDLRGAYNDFKFVYETIGRPSTALDGVRRLEEKLQVQKSAIPVPDDIDDSGVDDTRTEVRAFERKISQLAPKYNHRESVAGAQERCQQCGRGGHSSFRMLWVQGF